ncbi:peptidase S10 [Pelomonas sp. SE-A7]|uniref:S10 family serine carboxypeptidase-like protein n=1 Tax=Pelomonas sp. SE-A7 TaxID=3054953 RepID=UPI00259CFBC4|nr:peptidase S10 [Pelomonas sp. SE-A7]MDM4767859.1 peptidase S10 [Pelomonas sp. SE-A7]
MRTPTSIRRLRGLAATALILLLHACGGGGGGSGGTSTPAPTAPVDPAVLVDPVAYAMGATDSLPTATESAAITHHQLSLSTGNLVYTATVGHLNAGEPNVRASMFYVAYTLDNAPANRPLVIFYNGGPGSASMWLHMGSYGPQRVVTNNPTTNIPLPYQVVDNAQTLLAVADLVFVDAIGTGYSQAVAPNNNRSFWGVDADASIFRDFVLRYVRKNQREAAPLVLFGESYGGLRTPILASALLSAGARLKAVVLHSAILNYNSNCGVLTPGRLSCGHYVPSYAATAAWYQRSRPVPTSLAPFAQGVIDYMAGTAEPAIDQYLRNALPLSSAVNQQLADYTGLAAAEWQATPLMRPERYRQILSPQTLLGRYDTRVSAAVGSALASEGDPSSTVLNTAFPTALADQLRQRLKYQAAVGYTSFNSTVINLWDWRHDGQELPDSLPDLSLALMLEPALKILVIGGYHDVATPFWLTELDLARLPQRPPGLQLKRYVGGHMTYLDDAVRPQMAGDLQVLLSSL